MTAPLFPSPSDDKKALEHGDRLTPKFGPDGLITAVVQDVADNAVLMVAHVNAEALANTLETGDAWFWSRSRKKLWRKGETSGHTLRVEELRIDCDQDCVLMRVTPAGPSCHTGARTCFYRVADGAVLRAERDD